MTKTIDDYYVLISTALADLQTLIDDCVSDTGYLPDVEFKVVSTFKTNKDGTISQEKEESFIKSSTFKKIGLVNDSNKEIEKLKKRIKYKSDIAIKIKENKV